MRILVSASDEGRSRRSASAWTAAGLLVLLIGLSVLNIHHIQRDTLPVSADASGYYRTALATYRLIKLGQAARVPARLLQPNIRPPLPQLITVGLFWLSGESSQTMARISILPFLWILLLATYGIGARLVDRPTGLVAAALLAGYPQVLGFSRIYWMDLPLAALAALCVWALLASDGLARRGAAVGFGLSVGLGMLTKYTLPVFLVGPLIWVLVARVRAWPAPGCARRRLAHGLLENLSLALLGALLVCGVWYVNTLGSAWSNFVFNQGAGVLRPRAWWSLDNLLLYPRHLAVQVGPLQLSLLLVALPLLVRSARRFTTGLLLSWVLVPYLFFTFLVMGMEWSRFTLPYLPALALVSAVGLMQFRFLPLARGAAAAACVLGLLGAVRLSFAAPPVAAGDGFPWRRSRTNGMLVVQSFDLYLELDRLFPPLPNARLDRSRRVTGVAIFPDAGNMASVLDTWAMEQRAPLRISVPHEPEGFSFGRFHYPQRVSDPAYLLRHDYVVRMLPPLRFVVPVRRPDIYRRFVRLWQAQQQRYELADELRLPNGFRLLIHRRREIAAAP